MTELNFLTVPDLAVLTKLSKTTLYTYIEQGLIPRPSIQKGFRYFYNLENLQELKQIVHKIKNIKEVQRTHLISEGMKGKRNRVKVLN